MRRVSSFAARLTAALAVLALLSPAASAARLFGLVDTGELYVSDDQGVNWAALSTLPVRDAVALAAGVSTSRLFLAGRSGVVYRSIDGGTSWTAVGAVAASDVVDLVIRPDLSLLLLTESGSVYRSVDEGVSFTGLAALTAPDFASLTQTLPNQKLYALSRTGGVYESLDGGPSWAAKGAFTAPDAVELRALGSTLYALTGTGDVYRSMDAATNWTPVGTLSQVGMTGMAHDGTTLLATTEAGEVATSSDGASWTWRGVINQLTVMALATDAPATTAVGPAGPGRIALSPPWPNPGSGQVSVAFSLASPAPVTLRIYDIGGRLVRTLVDGVQPSGPSTVSWNGRTDREAIAEPGLYFFELRGAAERLTRRFAWLH